MSRTYIFWHVASLVIFLDASCRAQFPATLKPHVAYQHELQHALHFAGAHSTGLLTRLGTELLLNDAANSQLIVVDTKSFADTVIPLDSAATGLATESLTDMIFVESHRQIGRDDAVVRLVCYESVDSLKKQQKLWELNDLPVSHQEVRWLPERQRFIVFSIASPQVNLLGNDGVKLAEHTIKGTIIGIDECDEGFSVFCIEKANGRSDRLILTQLDDSFKVIKKQRLYLIESVWGYGGGGGKSLGTSRSFRLRGLKSGEVTKYLLAGDTQPKHLESNVQLPISNLPSKLWYANKLSAAESPEQPSVIAGLHSGGRNSADGFILFDRQSNFYYDPDQMLEDAIFNENRRMIVTVGASAKPRHCTVRLISFE